MNINKTKRLFRTTQNKNYSHLLHNHTHQWNSFIRQKHQDVDNQQCQQKIINLQHQNKLLNRLLTESHQGCLEGDMLVDQQLYQEYESRILNVQQMLGQYEGRLQNCLTVNNRSHSVFRMIRSLQQKIQVLKDKLDEKCRQLQESRNALSEQRIGEQLLLQKDGELINLQKQVFKMRECVEEYQSFLRQLGSILETTSMDNILEIVYQLNEEAKNGRKFKEELQKIKKTFERHQKQLGEHHTRSIKQKQKELEREKRRFEEREKEFEIHRKQAREKQAQLQNLKRSLNKFQIENKSKEHRIQNQQRQKQNLKRLIKQINQKIKGQEVQIQSLKEKLGQSAEHERQVSIHVKQNKELQLIIEAKEKQIDSINKKLFGIERDLFNKNMSMQDLERHFDQTNRKIKEQKRQKVQLNLAVNKGKEEIKALQKRLSIKEDEIGNMSINIKQVQRRQKELIEQNSVQSKNIFQIKSKFIQVQSKIKLLQAKNQELQYQLSNIPSMNLNIQNSYKTEYEMLLMKERQNLQYQKGIHGRRVQEMREQIRREQEQKKVYVERCRELQADLQRKRLQDSHIHISVSRIEQLQFQLQKSYKKINELQSNQNSKQLINLRGEVGRLQTQLQYSKEDNARIKSNWEELRVESAKNRAEIGNLMREVQKLEVEGDRLKRENVLLKDKIQTANKGLQRLKQQNFRLSNEAEIGKTQLLKIKQQSSLSLTTQINQSKSSLQKCRWDLQNLRRELDEQRSCNSRLSVENDSLKHQVQQFSKGKIQLTRVKNELSQQQVYNENYKRQNQMNLRLCHQNNHNLQKQIKQLKNQLYQIKDQYNREKHNKSLNNSRFKREHQECLFQLEKKKEELNKCETQKYALINQINQYKNQIQCFQREFNNIGNLQFQVQQLKSDLIATRNKQMDFKKQADKIYIIQREKDTLQKTLQTYLKQKKDAESKFTFYKGEFEKQKEINNRQMKGWMWQKEKLIKEKQKLEGQRQVCLNEIQELRVKVQYLSSKMQKEQYLEGVLSQKDSHLYSLKAQLQSLKNSKINFKPEDLIRENQCLRRTNQGLCQRVHEMTSENGRLREQIEGCKRKVVQINSTMQEYKNQIRRKWKEQRECLVNAIQQHQQSIIFQSEYKGKIRELEQKIVLLSSQINRLQHMKGVQMGSLPQTKYSIDPFSYKERF